MHLYSVHSIGIKLWRKISYNIPLKYKCIFRVKDNRRNMREWSLRKKFTDMVSCVPGLNDELQFSTFRRLGYGGYLKKWESIFSFLFFSFFLQNALDVWQEHGLHGMIVGEGLQSQSALKDLLYQTMEFLIGKWHDSYYFIGWFCE